MLNFIRNTMLLFAFVLMTSVTAQAFTNNSNKATDLAVADSTTSSKQIAYQVFGMDCPGCQSALEKQLMKIDGLVDAKASWKKQQVIITVDSTNTVKEEELFKRIRKANFTPGVKIDLPKNDQDE